MAVALTALGADRPRPRRNGAHVPMPGLHRLPGDEPERDTVLDPGDLITAVELPSPDAAAARSAYRKVRERASFSFAVVSVAAARRACATASSRSAGSRSAASPTCRGGRRRRRRPCSGARGDRARASPPRPTPSSPRPQPLRDNAYKVPLARNVLVSTLSELCA